jgi:predicted DNA-binding WGR domain protein
MIERDLFGTVRLVRNWGRIGTSGQELVEIYADELEAGQTLEEVARAKRRRGYRGLERRRKKPCPLRGRASFSSPSENSENRTSSAHGTCCVKSTNC